MHSVSALKGGQTEALQGLRQDHRRPAAALSVLAGLREGGVDLLVVVTTRLHVRSDQLLVRPMTDQVSQAIGFEHLCSQERTVLLGGVALTVSVGAALQDVDKFALGVALQQAVPLGAPDK